MMSSTVVAVLLLVVTSFTLASRASPGDRRDDLRSETYKFLYFPSPMGGSHYAMLTSSANELAQRGHKVVFLQGSYFASSTKKDTDLFSIIAFNSSYTAQNKTDIITQASRIALKGGMSSLWTTLMQLPEGTLLEIFSFFSGDKDCDNLLGDSAIMDRLRQEAFDMLVGDDEAHCTPLLAQALDIPFILSCNCYGFPANHQTSLPMNPCYIPERTVGLTDKMTFFQRVQNVLVSSLQGYLFRRSQDFFDELKIKYDIRPEISAYESRRQAKLHVYHGSFGLDFPRPMQPNTINILHSVGSVSNVTVEKDVARFLDTALAGIVLFSFGTYLTMEPNQAQMFADGFASLPYSVLWQSKGNLSAVKLGNNTKIVKWLPLAKVMEHANIKAYVSHGGAPSMYEALWAGLPMVGLPVFGDQMDNMLRLVNRGAGLSLDITAVTPETLRTTINRVITEPAFRANAKRISAIIRDLQTSPPVEVLVHWILHVTKFGGDHLRPAVHDLTYVQSSLLDVYLFISVALAVIVALNMSVCCFCCKCMCRMSKGGNSHLKKE